MDSKQITVAALAAKAASYLAAAAECGITELTECSIQNHLMTAFDLPYGKGELPGVIAALNATMNALCDAGFTPTIVADYGGHLPAFYCAA